MQDSDLSHIILLLRFWNTVMKMGGKEMEFPFKIKHCLKSHT